MRIIGVMGTNTHKAKVTDKLVPNFIKHEMGPKMRTTGVFITMAFST